jgi:hypothetical protein
MEKPLTDEEMAERRLVLSMARLVIEGHSMNNAAKQLELTPSIGAAALQRFMALIKWRIRTYGHAEIMEAIDSNSLRAARSQSGLLLECANRFEVELNSGSHEVWKDPITANLGSIKVLRKKLPPPPDWTPQMDGLLGTRSDFNVARQTNPALNFVSK